MGVRRSTRGLEKRLQINSQVKTGKMKRCRRCCGARGKGPATHCKIAMRSAPAALENRDDAESGIARIYLRGGKDFAKLPKMGRRDPKLLDSVFYEFAKKSEWGGEIPNYSSCSNRN